MKRERGEYRPIYESLLDGPQFQALTPAARLCLVAIKLKSGACGMRSIPGVKEALREWTGLSAKAVHGALLELNDADWIRIDRSVVWVVRGLEFEPTMDSANAKQRTHVQRIVEALPSVAIIAAFKARYAPWFTVDSGTNGDSPEEGYREPIEEPSIADRSTNTSTSTIHNSLVVDRQSGAISPETALTRTANQAITDKWGEQLPPIYATSGGASELATAIAEQGIPLEFAQRSIVRQVKTKRGDPPGSMNYFAKGIAGDWKAHNTHVDARSAPRTGALEPVRPKANPYGAGADMVLAAVEHRS